MVQGFVNWFCTSMIDQFGFVEYTRFKYFLIITKGSQLINWYFKNEHYECVSGGCGKFKEIPLTLRILLLDNKTNPTKNTIFWDLFFI